VSPAPLLPRDPRRHPPALAPAYRSSVLRAPRLPPVSAPQTLTELTGPVFGHDAIGPLDNDLLRNFATTGEPIGERMVLHGRVLDENARPVPGVLVEIWQANAGGRYRHVTDGYLAPLDPNFGGCGRTLTDAEGGYAFRTLLPGAYPWRNGGNDWRPAHVHVSLSGPAFGQRLVTQMYFGGDPLLARCPIAQSVPDAEALAALVATLDMAAAVPFDCLAWRFDIVLRGRRATPFAPHPGAG
jgi:protocatechuate 3,4-dioxygenase beta subunit